MGVLIIIVIVFIFWKIISSSRKEATLKTTIHIILDHFEEEESQRTAIFIRELYKNKNGIFDTQDDITRTLEYANFFIMAVLSFICTASKGNIQKQEMKHIAHIITNDAELYSKLYNIYSRTIYFVNKQEISDNIYTLPNTEFIHTLRAIKKV